MTEHEVTPNLPHRVEAEAYGEHWPDEAVSSQSVNSEAASAGVGPEHTEDQPPAPSVPSDEPSERPDVGADLRSEGQPDLTGVAEVDRVLARLPELDELPVSAHVEAYEDAHRQLHESLLAAGEEAG